MNKQTELLASTLTQSNRSLVSRELLIKAKNGNADALYDIGITYLQHGNYGIAERAFSFAAKKNHVLSLCVLALLNEQKRPDKWREKVLSLIDQRDKKLKRRCHEKF